MTAPVTETDTRVFEDARPRLLAVAMRVLRSAPEAEDVVQETWLRWQSADRREVRDPSTFLATATLRLALNVASSARVRHETTLDPLLPEPADADADPAAVVERRDTLSRGLRDLLERLSPAERAAYVLREGFGERYRQVADTLDVTEPNARQVVRRARQHLAGERRRRVGGAELRLVVDAFVSASQTGDLTGLGRVLARSAA